MPNNAGLMNIKQFQLMADPRDLSTVGPLALILTLGLLHRSLRTRGFTFRGQRTSTDSLVLAFVFLAINLWTLLLLVPILIKVYQTPLLSIDILATITTADGVPWIAELFSLYWLIDYLSSAWYEPYRSDSDQMIGLWKMDCSNGPFGWRESMRPWALTFLFAVMATIIVPSGLIAVYQGMILHGVLNIVAFVLFFKSAFPHNKYTDSPHRYQGDMLRIVLPTSHLEGTVYVLPSRKSKFRVVWSPKIAAEHHQTDSEMMMLFSSMRSRSFSLSEPLRRLRRTLSAYNERTTLTNQQLIDLAEWLLLKPNSAISNPASLIKRQPKTHLIGRDLMYALAHAEYLVFVRRDTLPENLRDKLGMLREPKRSGGLRVIDTVRTIGYKDGFEGYQEAVRYIYDLLDIELDHIALHPPEMVLPLSSVLGRRPTSVEDYVGSLWTLCLEFSESTFSALYMFCCIWFVENGNVGGFHIFPFVCHSHQGDNLAWQMIWRQGWYECILAQLIASSPLIAFGFAVGLV